MTDKPLSTGNQSLLDALIKAAGAIQQLDAQGVTVLDIDVRAGAAVLRIKRPPPFVTGTCRLRAPHGRYRMRVFAAPFHGVQLEWTTLERAPRLAGAMQ